MSLLNTRILKPETEAAISKLGPLAEQIADRWVSGWKKETLALERSGELLARIKSQVERESQTAADARVGGENSHLAHHELMELYGISPNEGP